MPVFFNDEMPPTVGLAFIPPIPECMEIIARTSRSLSDEHQEYGIVGAAVGDFFDDCRGWINGATIGAIGALLCLCATFGRCLNEAEDKTEARRAEKFFQLGMSVLMQGGDIAGAQQRAIAQGCYSTAPEKEIALYTYSAGRGRVPRDIKSYIAIIRRSSEAGPRDAFPALEACCAACSLTGDDWDCAASGSLQTLASLLITLIDQAKDNMRKTHKTGGAKFTEAVLFRPLRAVWQGMSVRDGVKAVRDVMRW